MSLVTERVSIKSMLMPLLIQKRALIYSFLLLILSALFSCAPQGQGILGNPSQLKDIVSQSVKDAPFAYDVAVDTISYNSCVAENINSTRIHGLKVGASEGFDKDITSVSRGGLKLRTDFLLYVGKKFNPEFPNTSIQPSQIQKILSGSDYNKDAFIQMSVRRKSDYAAIPDLIAPGNNGTKNYAVPGRDVSVMPQILHSGILGYQITKGVKFTTDGNVLEQGGRVYNLSSEPAAAGIEAAFNFNATNDVSAPKLTGTPTGTENYGTADLFSQKIRDDFNSNANLLTVTFGGADSRPDPLNFGDTTNYVDLIKRPFVANSQSADNTKAFGRGFKLAFTSPNPGLASWPRTKLTNVVEINLDDGNNAGGTSWTCENFLIMKSDQWNNNSLYSATWTQKDTTVEPSCVPIVGPDLTGTDGIVRQDKIKRLRRHYSVSEWNIGLYSPPQQRSGYTEPNRTNMQLCLTPKTGECYLPTTGILDDISRRSLDVGVQYDTTQDCYLTTAGGGDTRRDLGRCAHFASVCVRQSSNF